MTDDDKIGPDGRGGANTAGQPGPGDEDYDVGYGRPPKSGQFQEGNPGRPKGSRNKPKTFAQEIDDALDQELATQGLGGPVTAKKVIARKVVREAVTGDAKTTQEFVRFYDKVEARERHWKRNNKYDDSPLSDILASAIRRREGSP